jgi:uncharacterized protein
MAEEKTVAGKKNVGAPGDKASFVTLVETIGEPGEQGEAWLAHSSKHSEVQFVVKICRTPSDSPQISVAEFQRECEVLAHMQHPNIVKIFHSGTELKRSGTLLAFPFYVMDYLGKGVVPLNKAAAPGSRKLFLTLCALRDCASALAHVHQKECVHGDVKESNILVSGKDSWTPQLKLIDFGFSRHLIPGEARSEAMPAGPQKPSSIRRFPDPKTPKHHDIYQLCRMVSRSLEECPAPDKVGPEEKKYWPLDYAMFPRLLKLLEDWGSDKINSKPDTAEIDEFYRELATLMPIYDLLPDVHGALRYFSIPEIATTAQILQAFEAVRIPPRQLVLYTERIKRLITTREFGKLRYVRQLGFTHLVYPGAQGTRFEHSLGMYDLACQIVIRMSGHGAFREVCNREHDVLKFIVAALLHDVGHFPFAHQLEEFRANDFEFLDRERVQNLILGHHYRGEKIIEEMAGTLRELFNFSQKDVDDVGWLAFSGKREGAPNPALSFFRTLLDGPIDLDKLDYIERDAHHCGVPYGAFLDIARIKETMQVVEGARQPVLAFDPRVVGSLEEFANARHQLYANVYWHRAVRSATVMFKHAFYVFQTLVTRPQLEALFYDTHSDDCLLYKMMLSAEEILQDPEREGAVKSRAQAVRALLLVVSGTERILYKAILEKVRGSDTADIPYGGSNYREQRDVARDMYGKLESGGYLTNDAWRLGEHNVLIDCRADDFPPFEDIDIVTGPSSETEKLGVRAPSISRLRENFRKQACKIRVFVNPAVLAPKYQTKRGRVEVKEFLIAQCGLK